MKPNIVLILADDMGFSDLGCYGGEIETPNLDRLAHNGLRFSRFYNNAVCMPTRASILTGLYPHQVNAGNKARLLETGNVTIAEILRTAGYRTLMSGKWHNGSRPGELPVARGFDRYWGLLSGSSNYFNPGLPRHGEPEPAHKRPGDMRPWGDDHRVIHPFTPEDPDFYATDAFTDKAIEFLNAYGHDDQPFFLYLAYTAPHFPMQARPEDIEKYRGRFMEGWDVLRERRFERLRELGLLQDCAMLSPRDPFAVPWDDVPDKEAWDLRMAVYAAMIDRMDQGIGRVVSKVRELGKEQNTLFIFLSDNGGCAEPINATPDVPPGPVNSYCTVGASWANLSNTPFRRFKVFDHEGGISTPMIVSWPAVLRGRSGSVCHEVGHVIDLMPTFVELSGAQYPAELHGHPVQPMEGRSLLPILMGEDPGERGPLFWEFGGCRAIRLGQWKAVSEGPERSHVNIPVGPGHEGWELYDMSSDRSETSDLSHRYPDKVKELDSLWQDWWRRVGSAAGEPEWM